MAVNWIAGFNRPFVLLNRDGPTYCIGPNFRRMAQQIALGTPNYQQLLQHRQQLGKSGSHNSADCMAYYGVHLVEYSIVDSSLNERMD